MDDKIKELAEQSGIQYSEPLNVWMSFEQHLERFAELVAEQTHTNNKAKWYQEGYEAGRQDERDTCAKLVEEVGRQTAAAIRARGDKHD